MTITASRAFHAHDPEKRTSVAFRKGDLVPAHIAAGVGRHLLNGAPVIDADAIASDGNVAALVAEVDRLQQENASLLAQVAELEEQAKDAAAAVDGDGADLDGADLDALKDGVDGDGAAASAGPAFDPTEHKVAEVLEYLETADSDEFDRVIAAEKAGDNRKSITGG